MRFRQSIRAFNVQTSKHFPLNRKLAERTMPHEAEHPHEPQTEEPTFSMKLSTSSPRPSPPSAMEERVAAGRERRRSVVRGLKARIVRGNLTAKLKTVKRTHHPGPLPIPTLVGTRRAGETLPAYRDYHASNRSGGHAQTLPGETAFPGGGRRLWPLYVT